MIIKGRSVAGATRLAAHLLRADHNERVDVRELRGSAASDLRGVLADMEAMAAGTLCRKPLYHASINTRNDEILSDEQRLCAIDRLESKLGLTGQPRAVVVHEKDGREHTHIVWARADPARKVVISDSHNYRKHEAVARQLEREFGHQHVDGVHVDRKGKDRPQRTPDHDEMQQAARGGVTPAAAKVQVTAIWRRTATGQAFAAALSESGWTLCRGDRRDFVLMDGTGCIHGLARRVQGACVADIRARMQDVDPMTLPTVSEARRSISAASRSPASATVMTFPRAASRLHDPGRPQRQAA